jgi:dihydroorotate dehydrogenase electron transfer subunit
MKQLVAIVISIERILPEFRHPPARTILDSWFIWLKCPGIAAAAKPGQFVMVNCGKDCYLPRPFSIHQVDNDNIALFLAAYEGGKGTQWLSQRRVGDKIGIFGPLGNGFAIFPDTKNLLLVAGGHGIAPLIFLANQALNQGLNITLLYGTANQYQYPGTAQNPKSYLHQGIILHTTTEDGSKGTKGLVTNLLKDFVSKADQVFACGPTAMYKSMARMPELKGRDVQLSLEIMMGCGMGVCYGCTIKTKSGLKQVCKDGPVFEMGEVEDEILP